MRRKWALEIGADPADLKVQKIKHPEKEGIEHIVKWGERSMRIFECQNEVVSLERDTSGQGRRTIIKSGEFEHEALFDWNLKPTGFGSSTGFADDTRVLVVLPPQDHWPISTDAGLDTDLANLRQEILRRMVFVLLETMSGILQSKRERLVWPIWRHCFAYQGTFQQAAHAIPIGLPVCFEIGRRICASLNDQAIHTVCDFDRFWEVASGFTRKVDPIFDRARRHSDVLHVFIGTTLERKTLSQVCRRHSIHRKQAQRIAGYLDMVFR